MSKGSYNYIIEYNKWVDNLPYNTRLSIMDIIHNKSSEHYKLIHVIFDLYYV